MTVDRPFIRRVRLRNYKSIAACDVALGGLDFLVGRNGAGKSNFLNAISFVADALRGSLDLALRERGSIEEVRRRSGGHPTHFTVRLDFELPSGETGLYGFSIGAKRRGGYVVQEERCDLPPPNGFGAGRNFHVRDGEMLQSSIRVPPVILTDRLFLVAASGLPEFRPVFDALSRMVVYNINRRLIADVQQPDPGDLLRRDGSNAASVFQSLPSPLRQSVERTLASIVPGTEGIERRDFGGRETLIFRQRTAGQADPWRFPAGSMSDGTLRAFGVLLAVAQLARQDLDTQRPLLIGIEEPEVALYPGAAATLLGALREGARSGQILISSHSPELLDNADISADQVLAVDSHDGMTRIGALDGATQEALRDHLFTAGELLRQDQLAPHLETTDGADARQYRLFEPLGS